MQTLQTTQNQFTQPLPQNPPNQMQQNKCKVFIDNLDQGIQEDYLYKKFKEECGQIVALKINKDKTSQRSRGTAVITFAYPDFAEEARKKFNGSVLIKNVIRVKTYLIIHDQDKQANIHIRDVDEKVTIQKLEETFSEFGNVQSIDMKLSDNGKSLGYGYIQFENKEDVTKLLESLEKTPIVFEGKKIIIEKFKTQSERQGATTSVFLRAFALKKKIDSKFVKAYERGWQLIIQQYFEAKNIGVKSTFVKYDDKQEQPWAMVIFNNPGEAQDLYNECESSRSHQCLQSSAKKAFELLTKFGPSKTVDGTEEYKLVDVKPFFDELASGQDLYKGDSSKFFYNFMKSKHQNVDKRLLLIRNIKAEVSLETLTQFFEKFGRIVRISISQNKNPKFKTQQCFIHYQAEADANNALSEVYEHKMKEEITKIFNEPNPYVTILVPKIIRKEIRQLKTNQSESNKQHPSATAKLLPTWQTPMTQMPYRLQGQQRPFINNNQMQQQPPFQQAQRPFQGGPPHGGGQQRMPYNNNPQRQFKQQVPRQPYPQGGGQPFQQGGQPFQQGPMQMNMGGMNMNQMRPQQPFQRLPQMQQGMNQQGGQQMLQQTQQPQFRTYEDVTSNMPRFTEQNLVLQRQQLGLMLHPLVETQLRQMNINDTLWVQRITGMLIDEKLFEIQEILQLFEGPEELNERIQEGVDLMKEEQGENGQN